MPQDVVAAWRAAGARGRPARADWQQRLAAKSADVRMEFNRRVAGERPAATDKAIADLKARLIAQPQTVATRKASELALDVLTEAVPELVLGSADLTPSNNTRTKSGLVV